MRTEKKAGKTGSMKKILMILEKDKFHGIKFSKICTPVIFCLSLFVVNLVNAGEEKNMGLKQIKFDKLPVYYTGKIFPTPQKAEYADKLFSLAFTAIIPGKDLKKDNMKVRFLEDKIEMSGGKAEITDNNAITANYDTIIYLNCDKQGIPPPDRTEGYSISCSTKDNKNIVSINSKDSRGLLWGITSLTQLIETNNNKPLLRSVNVSDYPDNEIRGFLTKDVWGPMLPEYLFYTKLNSAVIQYAFRPPDAAKDYWRNKNILDAEKIRMMKFYGAQGKLADICIYYGVRPVSGEEKYQLRCSDEEDFKALYHIACLLAENNCGFYLAFDDHRFPLHPDDMKKFGSARESDIYFANRLYTEVKKKYPGFKMVFCPPFYWGPTVPAPYPENREEYLKALGERLDKDIDVFWTGPRVCSSSIDSKDVEWINSLVKRKPILFQNGSGTPHIYRYSFVTDPIKMWGTFAYKGFYQDVKAVFLNTDGTGEASTVATLGDYLWNEKAYSPEESVKVAVGMFFGPEAFEIFDNLNNKLSYFDVYGLRPSPGAAMKINELESRFKEVEDACSAAEKYNKFALENLSGMKGYVNKTRERFINKLKTNPNLKAFAEMDAKVQADAKKEANLKKEDILFTPNNFLGGCGPSNYTYQCPPRLTTWIYGKKTANFSMTTDFECEPFPPAGDYTLIISGQDDDTEKECNIEIKVNDRIIFSGASGFATKGWSLREFKVPADSMKHYGNKLTITNIEDSDIRTGPPFFMLNYAVLKK